METLVSSGVIKPDGIAVDWIARNVYWTDSGTRTIEVSKADGSTRKKLVYQDLDQPRTIVLDPVKGWVDIGLGRRLLRFLNSRHLFY